MKIAIAARSMVLGYGIDEIISIISRELVKNGHEVTILATELRMPLDNTKARIVPLQPRQLAFLDDYWQRHFLLDVRSFNHYVRATKAHDLLLTCDPMHFIGAGTKIRFRKPVIMYFFGVTPHQALDSFERRLESFRQMLTWNASFRFADYIMTNSKHSRDMLPLHLRKKAVINYHGIEHLISDREATKEFRRKLNIGDRKLILSIGRFSTPYKGMRNIAQMFKRISEKRNDVTLLLVGGGDVPEDMTQFQTLKNSHIMTNVPYSILKTCLGACDVYCTASEWEGFNIPLVAAQANGKPVVAFDVGAHSEVVLDRETGFLVPSQADMLDRLELLLEDDKLRTQMGNKAVVFAENFSWRKSIEILESLMRFIQDSYGL